MPETLRADARRNRDRVLSAAQEAFAEAGSLVPLDEIARRAGVGAGTVYRHFSTKESLFAEVVVERLEAIIEEGRSLASAADPGQAFFDYFALVVERATFNRAVCEALEQGAASQCSARIDVEFGEAFDTLLRRAQEAGAVRPDVDITDVRALLGGCLAMERGRRLPGRMAALASDALRPQAVTKSELRNVTCEVCGRALEPSRSGRPARYCSPACRQKAHRQRHPATS
ncbi:TetR/AcrR family transcriptional regulator [Microlunatus sp. GCM10028923]|uniref:TetR/AcrR family transcriptional regulator n=1 Tax=Microlunatus sp. GCM10028923 TaxID=3273400 RepID=UPI003607BC85